MSQADALTKNKLVLKSFFPKLGPRGGGLSNFQFFPNSKKSKTVRDANYFRDQARLTCPLDFGKDEAIDHYINYLVHRYECNLD